MLALIRGASLVRLALRRGLLLPESPRLCLLVEPHEINSVLTAWRRVPHSQHFSSVDPEHLQRYLELQEQPLLVAVSPHFRRNSSHRTLLESLEMLDPRVVRTVSVLSLFEQQQERLPPVLLRDFSFIYDDLPWAATFSVQAQLKRMADLMLSVLLLTLTLPFMLLAALLIWLQDRGPIFYSQKRSDGWVVLLPS